MQLLVLVYGDAAAVVLYGDGLVLVDCHLYMGAVASHCFVDGVIHGLVNEVVETLLADVTNVHRGAFAHGFQAFKHLDVAG